MEIKEKKTENTGDMKHTYTLEQFKKEIYYLYHESNGYGVHQLFDTDFEGGCPCANGYLIIDKVRYDIDTHCWRGIGHNTLKVRGGRGKKRQEIIDLLKLALDKQDWYGEYEVI